jgi:hypothetical protein
MELEEVLRRYHDIEKSLDFCYNISKIPWKVVAINFSPKLINFFPSPQNQHDRITILSIMKGSILIKFEIAANRTATEVRQIIAYT